MKTFDEVKYTKNNNFFSLILNMSVLKNYFLKK